MTLICRTHKFIFVHIPRTGGSSIKTALQSMLKIRVRNHLKVSDLRRAGQVAAKTFPKFTFVRNPWDWLYSLYCMLKLKKLFAFNGKLIAIQHEPGSSVWEHRHILSFADCILNHPLPDSQLSWILDKKGNPSIDFIGHFESLQIDLDRVCDIFGFGCCTLPHVDAYSDMPYREAYTDEMWEKVAKEYRESNEFFGYNDERACNRKIFTDLLGIEALK